MGMGKNTCKWLTLSSTEFCGRRCVGEYCGIHLDRLREGGGTEIWEIPSLEPTWAADSIPGEMWQREWEGTPLQLRRCSQAWIPLLYEGRTVSPLGARWEWRVLGPSTLRRYGTDVTKALGIHAGTRPSAQAITAPRQPTQIWKVLPVH